MKDFVKAILAVLLIVLSACGKDHDGKPRDGTSPTVTIETPTTAATYATDLTPLTLGGTASDNRSVTSVDWFNTATGSTGVASGTDVWTATVSLALGSNYILVTAVDPSGNLGSDEINVVFSPDTTPPTVTIDTPTASDTYTSLTPQVSLGGTATDANAVVSVDWFNSATGAMGSASGTSTWSATVSLDPGSNYVILMATDDSANVGFDAINVIYTPDTTPPTIQIDSPTTADTYGTDRNPLAIGGTAGDDRALALVEWTNTATGDAGTATGTSNWTAMVPLMRGINYVVATATDAAGNQETDAIRITYAPPLFGPPTNYLVGNLPEEVRIADFDRDGVPDLAVANAVSNDVSVLLGAGDGSFGAAASYPAAAATGALAVGDFDRDGILDLAATNRNSNDVSILLGTGTGAFALPVNYPVGMTDPREIISEDLNRDGALDLAIACRFSGLSVLLGTGTGSFIPAATYPAGNQPVWIAGDDFDRDGIYDLAVANSVSDDVSVFLGSGTGAFGPASTYPAGVGPQSIATGDFDRDGVPDLVVSNELSDDLSVLLGTGTGAFTPTVSPAGTTSPWSVIVVDFNFDGLSDIIVANRGTLDVSVFSGMPSATFGPAQTTDTGAGASSVAVGDLNRDGLLDIVVGHRGTGIISVLLGN